MPSVPRSNRTDSNPIGAATNTISTFGLACTGYRTHTLDVHLTPRCVITRCPAGPTQPARSFDLLRAFPLAAAPSSRGAAVPLSASSKLRRRAIAVHGDGRSANPAVLRVYLHRVSVTAQTNDCAVTGAAYHTPVVGPSGLAAD
jgi:hypothetical protein